jgi:hypothetical protein
LCPFHERSFHHLFLGQLFSVLVSIPLASALHYGTS